MPNEPPAPLLCPERSPRKKPKRMPWKNFWAERADGRGRGRPVEKQREGLGETGPEEGGTYTPKMIKTCFTSSPPSLAPAPAPASKSQYVCNKNLHFYTKPVFLAQGAIFLTENPNFFPRNPVYFRAKPTFFVLIWVWIHVL